METSTDMQKEVERLSNELAETVREKVQAAEYGLVVLEEKQQLQAQYDDLESQFETLKTELECAREVSDCFVRLLSVGVIVIVFSFFWSVSCCNMRSMATRHDAPWLSSKFVSSLLWWFTEVVLHQC